MRGRVRHVLYGSETVSKLTGSFLRRCLQRHGRSRLPDMDRDKPKRQRFKRDPIGGAKSPNSGLVTRAQSLCR